MRKISYGVGAVLLIVCCVSAIRPKSPGVVPFNIGNFTPDSSEATLAYADFNRDGDTDILTRSTPISTWTTTDTLNLYIWNTPLQTFVLVESHPLPSGTVQTAIACSLYNGSTNLVTLVSANSSNSLQLYEISCSEPFVCQFSTLTVSELQQVDAVQPTLIVIKGELFLLYSKDSLAMGVTFRSNQPLQYSIAGLNELVVNGGVLTTYSAAYFGDYDGDCLSDLVLLVNTGDSRSSLQFLRATSNGALTLAAVAQLASRVQHFTLNDINFDGRFDLILLLPNGTIQIHYYNQLTAQPSQQLCSSALPLSTVPFDFSISPGQVSRIQQVSWPMQTHPSCELLFGDFNSDGYDDLTLTLIDQAGLPVSLLYLNTGCINEQCGTFNSQFLQESSTDNLRTFQKLPLSNIRPNSLRTSFFDFYHDGRMDLIVSTCQHNSLNIFYCSVQPILNNLDYDSFFLEVTVLSSNDRLSLQRNSPLIGASIAFYVTTLTGTLAPKVFTQLSQAGSLQLPKVLTGLGRTNNYVQYLTVTVPSTVALLSSQQLLRKSWTPIVPNSEIYVQAQDSSGPWVLQVQIEPTRRMAFVVVLIIVTLAVVGAAILRLTHKEKAEDEETINNFYAILR